MVMVTLKKPVQVAVGDCNFITVKSGTIVNYGCKKIESHWHHWFFAYVKELKRTIEFKMIIADNSNPEWL